jgi:hypothetical protein
MNVRKLRPSLLAPLLPLAFAQAPTQAPVRASLDSAQLVHRAMAVIDSARHGQDTFALRVAKYLPSRRSVLVELWTVRPMQGGGGRVRLDRAGRIIRIELFQ